MTSIPFHSQALYRRGTSLADGQQLREAQIGHGDTVNLELRVTPPELEVDARPSEQPHDGPSSADADDADVTAASPPSGGGQCFERGAPAHRSSMVNEEARNSMRNSVRSSMTMSSTPRDWRAQMRSRLVRRQDIPAQDETHDQIGAAASDSSRAIFYELLFYAIDSDGNSFVTFEDARQLLAFALPNLAPVEREAKLRECDVRAVDGKLDRDEFLLLCSSSFQDLSLSQLDDAARNYDRAVEKLQKRIFARMRRYANQIDRAARIIFPLLYFASMVLIYNINLQDKYSGLHGRDPSVFSNAMEAWVPSATVTRKQVVRMILTVCLVLTIIVAFLIANKVQTSGEMEERLSGAAKSKFAAVNKGTEAETNLDHREPGSGLIGDALKTSGTSLKRAMTSVNRLTTSRGVRMNAQAPAPASAKPPKIATLGRAVAHFRANIGGRNRDSKASNVATSVSSLAAGVTIDQSHVSGDVSGTIDQSLSSLAVDVDLDTPPVSPVLTPASPAALAQSGSAAAGDEQAHVETNASPRRQSSAMV